MKIVKILGGLGNQMFQYAFYIALKRRYPKEEVKIDLNSFRGYTSHNGFEVERVFRLSPALRASKKDILRLTWPYFHYRIWQIASRILPHRSSMCVEPQNMEFCQNAITLRNTDTYYDGYWQDQRYFVDAIEEVRKTFTFPQFSNQRNTAIAQIISTTNSVALHIRRGDYLKHKKYEGTCSIDYYARAIEKISVLHDIDEYFVFCNDFEWYNDNIAPLLAGIKVTYINWNKHSESFRDMQLMSMCRHLIIANSTFSWWAAMLHKDSDGSIIAPAKWFGFENYHFHLPEDWIAL